MQESLGFRLVQEQSQKVIMNQEMRQAITILQYSSQELTSFIEKQLEVNPLFDLDRTSLIKPRRYNTAIQNTIEHISRQQVSLEEHLLEQLSFHKLQSEQKKIGRYLIGLIDRDGYLREDLDNVATELNCTYEDVTSMLALIKTFEPTGVGACNLVECLLLQLRAKGQHTELIEQVVTEHLHELAAHKFAQLAQIYQVTEEEIRQVLEQIEVLQPRPGMGFEQGHIKYIEPDLYVEWVGDQLQLMVNERMYPQLKIDESYQRYRKLVTHDPQSKTYIQEHLRHAQWLIRSIEQRKMTILKVAEAILMYQQDFLVDGFAVLRPLTLQQIASDVGVHESTVSRATNQKYIQTNKGLFELKQFFVHGIATTTGQATTPYAIKDRIVELLAQEDAAKPYSDQQITTLLQQEGIQISRRTVMKYREELQIPSSSKRRRRQ